MKQAKAYINLSLNRNLSTANYVGVEEAIRQAQKDAYNQALEDLCEGDTVQLEYDQWGSVFVNKESILKLKK